MHGQQLVACRYVGLHIAMHRVSIYVYCRLAYWLEHLCATDIITVVFCCCLSLLGHCGSGCQTSFGSCGPQKVQIAGRLHRRRNRGARAASAAPTTAEAEATQEFPSAADGVAATEAIVAEPLPDNTATGSEVADATTAPDQHMTQGYENGLGACRPHPWAEHRGRQRQLRDCCHHWHNLPLES